jgi:hypothetical protein
MTGSLASIQSPAASTETNDGSSIDGIPSFDGPPARSSDTSIVVFVRSVSN